MNLKYCYQVVFSKLDMLKAYLKSNRVEIPKNSNSIVLLAFATYVKNNLDEFTPEFAECLEIVGSDLVKTFYKSKKNKKYFDEYQGGLGGNSTDDTDDNAPYRGGSSATPKTKTDWFQISNNILNLGRSILDTFFNREADILDRSNDSDSTRYIKQESEIEKLLPYIAIGLLVFLLIKK